MRRSRRLLICAVLAMAGGLIGPRLIGPQGRSAGAPFRYEPPERFVPFKEHAGELHGAKAWVFDERDEAVQLRASDPPGAAAVRVVVHHSDKEMSVEEVDLAKLANEMAKAFEDTCTWTHRRHELRTRPDGGRVGLIEGDCEREVELGQLGLPKQNIRSRKLQLMFPDDTGTSIVTASYPVDQAARWEPLFEATIAKAQGVAVRVPGPSGLVIVAWAAAGAVLGWLATAIARRKDEEPMKDVERRPKATANGPRTDEA